ncbi:MAG: ABC transporter ATP-binding protein [Alphaproteobacteria bacterium]|nr:ABC transporter ATP-binding protein [Alphaproteobacteria bacterium]
MTLAVENLSVTLATARGPLAAVRGLSFTLGRGESLGIVGESGCGKTMTALAIMGLLPEGAEVGGRIVWDGQDLLSLADDAMGRLRGRRLAMVFQEPMTALNPVQTIGDQIAEALLVHDLADRVGAMREAVALLERVGIADPERRVRGYPHQLSGGQRQRAMIAMALACKPDVLIADEPTSALDVTVQQQILGLIRSLAAERGMAMLLISHDLAVVAGNVARLLVMYAGRGVEWGETAQMFGALAHPYAQGLFRSAPARALTATTRPRRLPTIAGQVPDLVTLGEGCPFAERCDLVEEPCRSRMPEWQALAPEHRVACRRAEESLRRWKP